MGLFSKIESEGGKILHNSIGDTKAIVNPVNYYKTAKLAVHHPVRLGEGIVNSYVDLVKHPVRALEHPVTTALELAPLGKFADIGAEGALVSGSSRLMDSPAFGETERAILRKTPGYIPGARAAVAAKRLSGLTKKTYNDFKYDPGTEMANPIGHVAPGTSIDPGLFTKLHNELGNPNQTHGVQFMRSDPNRPLLGAHEPKAQTANAFVDKLDFTPGNEGPASAKLTESLLHEARHGYQQANWSPARQTLDRFRKYDKRRAEKDANQFMNARKGDYAGLVKIDPANIPPEQLPFNLGNKPQAALDDLKNHEEEIMKGTHGAEDAFTKAMDKAVADGHVSPEDAMKWMDELQLQYRRGPASSKEDLLKRAMQLAQSRR